MFTKKRIITVCAVIALVICVGCITAFAAIDAKTEVETKMTAGAGYTDINEDGVCDNIGTRPNFKDENNDGICDNRSENSNYTDENGDGVCDNYGQREEKRCQNRQNKQDRRGECKRACTGNN